MNEKNISEAENLRARLISASKAGTLLSEIYEITMSSVDDRAIVAQTIAQLHNDNFIDAVAAFKLLENKPDSVVDFFLTRHVFEQALPSLNSPVEPIMQCVLHLYRAAGNDMAAGLILGKFIDFCVKNDRPQEVIREIERNSAEYADLLTPAIIAGSKIDPAKYQTEALRLATHKDYEVKKRALFSLGKMETIEDPDAFLAALEKSLINQSDDSVCGAVIKSAFSIFKKEKSYEESAIALIQTALQQGSDGALHAASEILWLDNEALSEKFLDLLLMHLRNINVQNLGTLNNIDHGIAALLNGVHSNKIIQFLEDFLLLNSKDLSLENFDSVSHTIQSNKNIFERLITRWFLRGDRILCEGLRQISTRFHEKEPLLNINEDELHPKNSIRIVFLARKVIGYFFYAPKLATSLIISLMKQTQDEEVLKTLANLLTDPILLSHPNIADDFLSKQASQENEVLSKLIDKIIQSVEDYIKGIESVERVKEFRLDQAQREAYGRYMSRLMTESRKNAEEETTLFKLFSKSVLLYGRKSIDHIFSPDGQSHRSEMTLQSFSTSINIPRMSIIDPVSLDYVLRVYRVERFRT